MSDEVLAAIDIGTNTVLLTIARSVGGALQVVLERATITRLGRGVDARRSLDPAAVERTLSCLREYAGLMRAQRVARAAVVATSAARDASDGAVFLHRAAEVLGTRPRIISGTEEARLTACGALSGLEVGEGPVTIFDVGGGSTEVVDAERVGTRLDLRRALSLDVGSVRLTERCLGSDPPSVAELGRACALIDSVLGPLVRPSAPRLVVGVAGTLTTLAALALALEVYDPSRVHGLRLSRSQVDELVERLSRASLSERMAMPGVEPARADVIVAGALIVRALLAWTEAEALVVSDRGVRWGLLFSLMTC